MDSTLPREGLRPRARRLLSRLAAVLVVGSLAWTSAPVASAEDDPEPPAPEVTLSVSTGSGTVMAPGGPLVSTITLDNETDADLSAGSATLELNRTALADGAALDAWLDRGAAAGTFQSIAVEPTPVVDDGTTAAVGIVVDADVLGELAPGVYPISARLTGASTADAEGSQTWNLTASTVLVVSDRTPSTAVLVPITATPANGALLTAAELSALTASDGMLSGQLDAVTGSSAILAVDPSIAASIRLLGTSAPASATAWLERLESLPNDVFALQFGDADATVQAHAKLPELLGVPTLAPLAQAGALPTEEPTSTPAPSPTTTPELPDDEALTAILGAQAGILWPRGDVTAADLATFGAYLGDSVTTILPSTSVAGAPSAHGTVDGRELLIADAAASARASAAAEQTTQPEIDRELAAAAGHLFFTGRQSTTAILALDRSETRTPAALRDIVSAFATPSMSLTQLRAAAAASVTLAGEPETLRATALTALLADEQRLTRFATILDEPALLLTPDRIRLLRTIGVGVDDADFTARSEAQTERVQSTLDSVSIQRPKPAQLFTSAAPLPVWIRNDLPWTINATLLGAPSTPRLDLQPETKVEALAETVQRVDVPIQALVASGQVDVTFSLFSPTGVPIGDQQVANVTLRADWERIGLGILGGVIVVLFAFGVVRTVRKKKADAAAADDPDAAPSASEQGE